MRRALLAAACAVVTLVLLAGAAWQWWVPSYRPSLREGESYGIDVSVHQGAIDWPRVARDGIAFAYVKATEGGDHTDARFAENWRAAGEAGIDRGAYHFFTLCRPGDEQARHFLSVVPDGAELAPAVDLEIAGNCSRRPSREDVRRELDAFLRVVEGATRRDVVLYLGADWQRRYPVVVGDRPLWLRRTLRRPRGGWTVWQVQGRARVDGVRGGVDLDVMRVR